MGWERGGTAEVGWAIKANHGGGYSYRLCKVGEDGPGAVTEECFQRTPLKFASEDSWVQYGTDVDSKLSGLLELSSFSGPLWTKLWFLKTWSLGIMSFPSDGIMRQRHKFGMLAQMSA